MREIALVLVILSGWITSAFAQAAEIERANAAWISFFNKGDFAGIAALYTDDAAVLPPGSGIVKGRAAIEGMWKGAADKFGNPSLTTLDVKSLGPSAAREIGTFALKSKAPGGSDVVGKYVVVWEKQGQAWKLAVDIWNDGK